MKHLNVLYQSSDYYAPYAGVSICSLLENNKNMQEITVYLLDDAISKENKCKMQQLVESYNRKLVVIDPASIIKMLTDAQVAKYHGSYATFFKLFAISAIPDNLETLLYIDSDTIIGGSMEQLLATDLGEHPAGMCLDAIYTDYKAHIGIAPEQLYFNGGVVYFNVESWKKKRCEERILEHVKTVRSNYGVVDQDLINVVLGSEIYTLPITYNFDGNHFLYSPKQTYSIYKTNKNLYYSEEEIVETRGKAIINHCIGGMAGHPWEEKNIHAMKESYHTWLQKTPWSGLADLPYHPRTYNRIQRMLYFGLPRSLYVLLMRAALKRSMNQREQKAQQKQEV